MSSIQRPWLFRSFALFQSKVSAWHQKQHDSSTYEANHLDISLRKLILQLGKSTKLSRANRREICRMREEDRPSGSENQPSVPKWRLRASTHFPPNQSWKSISPCVVFAWKFGASDPRRNRGCSAVARCLRKIGEACLLTKWLRAGTRIALVVARNAPHASEAGMILCLKTEFELVMLMLLLRRK
jgi:hypothetical protein